MTVMANPKHERYAQELAKGSTADAAYQAAGYKPNRPGASRLATKVNIAARVAEILERAAAKTEVTVAGITERLLAIAAKGETSTEAPLLSVGRAALMDVAKLNGLVIDKLKHSGAIGTFDPSKLSTDDLTKLVGILGPIAASDGDASDGDSGTDEEGD